jgi:hypothetical protein
VASAAGLLRFAMTKAMTGIAEGGQRAASKSALWRLREVLLAEDAVRKGALVDVDGDGIGEARLIDELAGVAGPGRAALNLLNYQFKCANRRGDRRLDQDDAGRPDRGPAGRLRIRALQSGPSRTADCHVLLCQ